MEMVYKFAEGSRIGGDPNVVGRALHRVREQYGSLTPPNIVEAARPDTSPLHRYFEWDNKAAAEQWRLQQARVLVCSVVTCAVDGEEARPVRSFISVNKAYEPLEVVMSDAGMRAQALHDVREGIKSMKNKLSAFEEFADVVESLNGAEVAASRHMKRKENRTRVAAR